MNLTGQIADEVKRENKHIYEIVIALIVLTAIVLLVVLFAKFSSDLDKQLFAERRANLLNITDKLADEMDSTISNLIGDAENAVFFLEMHAEELPERFHDYTELAEHLQQGVCTTKLDGTKELVMIFDDAGNYYASDGCSGTWTEQKMLLSEGGGVRGHRRNQKCGECGRLWR